MILETRPVSAAERPGMERAALMLREMAERRGRFHNELDQTVAGFLDAAADTILKAAAEIPAWLGTTLESCIRDVARGRIAAHSSVTADMVEQWRALNRVRESER